MPSLDNGTYQIFVQASGQSVSRRLAEDRSFNPKNVVVRSDGMEPEAWTFEKVSDSEDQFILKVRGAPTANLNNQVYAILHSVPPPTQWTIRPVFDEGPNIYTILLSSDGDQMGWSAPSDDDGNDEISIQSLEGNRAGLFVITSVDE